MILTRNQLVSCTQNCVSPVHQAFTKCTAGVGLWLECGSDLLAVQCRAKLWLLWKELGNENSALPFQSAAAWPCALQEQTSQQKTHSPSCSLLLIPFYFAFSLSSLGFFSSLCFVGVFCSNILNTNWWSNNICWKGHYQELWTSLAMQWPWGKAKLPNPSFKPIIQVMTCLEGLVNVMCLWWAKGCFLLGHKILWMLYLTLLHFTFLTASLHFFLCEQSLKAMCSSVIFFFFIPCLLELIPEVHLSKKP